MLGENSETILLRVIVVGARRPRARAEATDVDRLVIKTRVAGGTCAAEAGEKQRQDRSESKLQENVPH